MFCWRSAFGNASRVFPVTICAPSVSFGIRIGQTKELGDIFFRRVTLLVNDEVQSFDLEIKSKLPSRAVSVRFFELVREFAEQRFCKRCFVSNDHFSLKLVFPNRYRVVVIEKKLSHLLVQARLET